MTGFIWSGISVSSRAFVAFGLFFFLSKTIDLDEFGLLTFYFSVSFLLGLFIDYGYSLKLIKDLSAKRDEEDVIISTAFSIKLLNSILVIMLSFFIPIDDDRTRLIFFLFLFGQILNQLGATIFPILRFKGFFKKEAALVVSNNVITLLVFFMLLNFDDMKFYALPISMLIGKLVLFLFFVLSDFFKVKVINRLFTEYKHGFSFFLHGSIGFAYMNLDTVLLKGYVEYSDIALYQAAMKMLVAAVLFSDVLINYFYPYMIKKAYKENLRPIRIIHSKIKYLFYFTGGVFSLLYYFIASYFTQYLFTDMFLLPQNLILLITFVVFLRYVGGYWGIILTIHDLQRYRVMGSSCALITVILAIIYLAPSHGILAGGFGCFLAHLVINALYFYKGRMCLKTI